VGQFTERLAESQVNEVSPSSEGKPSKAVPQGFRLTVHTSRAAGTTTLPAVIRGDLTRT
jgi:hypothetical protein